MKWRIRNLKQGQSEYRKKFALFPTRLNNGTWVWLEMYGQQYIWNGDVGWGWEKAEKYEL